MSDGKNIEIKIAATGGDAAAREIGKITKSTDDAAESQKHLKVATDNTADQASRLREIGAATGAIGLAAGFAAKAVGEVWDQLEKVDTVELRKLDEAWADQIENAKSFKEALQDPISALTALANGGTSIKEAFDGLDEQLKLNADARAEQVDRVIEKGVTQVEEIKRLTDELKAANALLNADDKAESSERDLADAREIRNGAPKEDVQARRAEWDAQKQLDRINRDLNEKKSGLQEIFNSANAYEGNAQSLEAAAAKRIEEAKADLARLQEERQKQIEEGRKLGALDFAGTKDLEARSAANLEAQRRARETMESGSTPEEVAGIAEAKEKAAQARAAFEKQKREVEQAERLAERERRDVRARETVKVEGFADQKSNRLKSEAAEAGRREQQKELERQRATGKAGRDAERLLPPGVSGEFKEAVQDVSRRLQDGDQGGELAVLARLLKEMGGSLGANDARRAREIAELKREIENINQRFRNR